MIFPSPDHPLEPFHLPELSLLKLGIIGAGTLGKALLHSWHSSGLLSAEQIMASTASEASLTKLKAEAPWLHPLHLTNDNSKVAEFADIVFICTKPDKVKSVATDRFYHHCKGKLIVSICAGLTLRQMYHLITQHASSVPHPMMIIRAIPNTACRVRKGIVSLCYSPLQHWHKETIQGEISKVIEHLFDPIGKSFWFDEKLINGATALGASSPALVAVMLDAMIDGGVSIGISRPIATQMAVQSMIGVCTLVTEETPNDEKRITPSDIKNAITTPGGCTITGLLRLEDGGVRGHISRAIQETAHFLDEKDNKGDRH